MTELKHIWEQLTALNSKNQGIKGTTQRLESRLSCLEDRDISNTNFSPPNRDCRQDPSASYASQSRPADASVDVQREYKTVKERYQRVQFPQELKVLDSRQRIKLNKRLWIFSIKVRNTETAVKILKDSDSNLDNTHVRNLFSVLIAHINSLKADYASLIVQSTFDEKESKLYKTLDNNELHSHNISWLLWEVPWNSNQNVLITILRRTISVLVHTYVTNHGLAVLVVKIPVKVSFHSSPQELYLVSLLRKLIHNSDGNVQVKLWKMAFCQNISKWREIGKSETVQDWIENGVNIAFRQVPNSFSLPNCEASLEEKQFINSEIRSLLKCGYIVESSQFHKPICLSPI